jgi:hypothetical protein
VHMHGPTSDFRPPTMSHSNHRSPSRPHLIVRTSSRTRYQNREEKKNPKTWKHVQVSLSKLEVTSYSPLRPPRTPQLRLLPRQPTNFQHPRPCYTRSSIKAVMIDSLNPVITRVLYKHSSLFFPT